MDRFDDEDEDEIPAGMRREIERLKGPPAMPRPDKARAVEITPVLSPGQTEQKIGEGTTVLHVPSGVVGVVKKVHGPGEYMVAPKGVETSGRPVSEPVAELEDGNAFLLRRGSFVVLDKQAAAFHASCVAFFASAVASTARLAASVGVEREAGLSIVRAVLSAQHRALSEHDAEVHRAANKIPVERVARRDEEDAAREADEHARDCVVSDEVG